MYNNGFHVVIIEPKLGLNSSFEILFTHIYKKYRAFAHFLYTDHPVLVS